MQFQFGETGRLGTIGYLLALVQVIGFSLGSLGIYLWLLTLPYCDKCNRYFKKVGDQIRYFSDPDFAQNQIADLYRALDDKQFQAVIDRHSAMGNSRQGNGDVLASLLSLKKCDHCGISHMEFVVTVQKQNAWTVMEEFRKEVLVESPIVLRS